MKLYYAVGSSSLTPHIVLIEAGLQFEGIKVDEHSKVIEGGGDYRAINPLGFVPALCLDDNTVITEVAAIVQYIADKAPAKKLAPPNGTVERVKLQSWLSFLSSEMHKGGFSPLFYKGMPEEGKEIFRRRLIARFSHLDRHPWRARIPDGKRLFGCRCTLLRNFQLDEPCGFRFSALSNCSFLSETHCSAPGSKGCNDD